MTLDLAVRELLREVVREELRALGGRPAADDILTYAEAAAYVKVDKSLIGRWVHDGLLPAHGQGKAKRVYRSDVRKALEQSSAPRPEPTATEIATTILGGGKVRKIR